MMGSNTFDTDVGFGLKSQTSKERRRLLLVVFPASCHVRHSRRYSNCYAALEEVGRGIELTQSTKSARNCFSAWATGIVASASHPIDRTDTPPSLRGGGSTSAWGLKLTIAA